MSFASIGVLVSCLLLTGAAVLFSANLSYAMKDIQDENVVTVYLKQEVGELEAVTLGSELKEISQYQGNCLCVPAGSAGAVYGDFRPLVRGPGGG